jgi:MarR family transcriptional regulator, organic hydroperoxide resistance regulator
MKPKDCIFFQLAKANQIGIRFLGQKVSALNITPVQALVLGFLCDRDQITSGELGKKTELDSATLTGILDRLEAAQLIERKANPNDRRSVMIHLTEHGKSLSAEAVVLIEQANKEFLSALTEVESHELISLIHKLRNQPER